MEELEKEGGLFYVTGSIVCILHILRTSYDQDFGEVNSQSFDFVVCNQKGLDRSCARNDESGIANG